MKNILLLNAGTRNTLIRFFKENCKEDTLVIATDSYELAPALYEADKYYVTYNWRDERYWDQIEDICIKEQVGIVLSLIDPELELLAAQRERFERLGIVVNIADTDTIKSTYDKFSTLEFVKNNGFDWIKSYVYLEDAISALKAGNLSFPLIVKPRRGSGSCGISIVSTIEQLENACLSCEGYLIQEYIDGQEIGADVYVDLLSREVISVFLKKKLKMRAGETDKSVSYINNGITELIKRFVTMFGLRGVNDIDIFEAKGKIYISEVNPRFGGGYIHAYVAGVNFPQYLMNNMNGIVNTPEFNNYEEGIYMMKYFDIVVKREEQLAHMMGV